jgi:porphobilinogen deaminase
MHRRVALRDEKEVRGNVKTRINKINDDGVIFGSFLITTLRIISILHIA